MSEQGEIFDQVEELARLRVENDELRNWLIYVVGSKDVGETALQRRFGLTYARAHSLAEFLREEPHG